MKKIIIGNWKMNPQTSEEARNIFSALKRLAKSFKRTELVICPPFIYLPQLSNSNSKLSNLKLGAQDVFWKDSGPFTGEVGVSMLKNVGASHVILGHSERRALGETDEDVNKKIKATLAGGLIPVVCVGEKERDNDGKFFEILRRQIKNTCHRLAKSDLSKIIIAYEPVWAIGKSEKQSMSGEDIYQMTIFIRKVLSENYGKIQPFKVPIIYGGSVTSYNVKDIIAFGQVSGILPGRASLDPKEMKEILEIVEKYDYA